MSVQLSAAALNRLRAAYGPDFSIRNGKALPMGATVERQGTNFAVFARSATEVYLVLFDPGNPRRVLAEIPLDPYYNRTGEVWHVLLIGVNHGTQYGWRLDRSPNNAPHIHRYAPSRIMLDPYAKALTGRNSWEWNPATRGHWHDARRCLVIDDTFDWGDDTPLNIPMADTIIYELHVRGFTRHPSSGVEHPGTFLGLIEKIPYLLSLGVTAVELLPVAEFEPQDSVWHNPHTGERLHNFWGYDPICFFAPQSAYGVSHEPGAVVDEFRTMVHAFHQAGIEVILDVVYNHTAEGDSHGPTLSFRGIDNQTFYILDPITGTYKNYSGCGNTLNCNHPVVRDLILECLRWWVTEMHVDGFRFDLASILGRGQQGEVLANPPLLERIAADPVLSNTKIIAEAWDAAGLYQVGSFPSWGRWAEWNGKFRDDVRSFVKSDEGLVPALASRLAGSPDLYHSSGRRPDHSVNFVTCHDGFTLLDLVSYNEKLNVENGESNRDGTNDNRSWNCGIEGPTRSRAIQQLRTQQRKNFLTILLFAHGVPMLLAGDEFGRTQKGNNNAYCQDNEISWVDWSLLDKNHDFFRFTKRLIVLRKRFRSVRPRSYDDPSRRIEWHGINLHQPDWSNHSRTLAMHQWRMTEEGESEHLYLIVNSHWESHDFELPQWQGHPWVTLIDTAERSPHDAPEDDEVQLIRTPRRTVQARSVVVLATRSAVLPAV